MKTPIQIWISAALINLRSASRCLYVGQKLTALILATAFSSYAVDKSLHESCFLAIPFGAGNAASIQLSNPDSREYAVTVDRYSATGDLLDHVQKSVPSHGNTEVRMDLSSSGPEFGWIRVLSEGKSVSVSATVETLDGNMLLSVPQKAVSRHPELSKKRMPAVPHQWKFDVTTNLGFLMYFVNLSNYPVQVAMCQDDFPDCSNPTLPHTLAPMASISFPIDQSRRYAVVESTPGYSAATALRLAEGTKQMFKVSSCIKLEGSTACSPQPLATQGTTTKFVSPLQQQLKRNMEASLNSPAAAAANHGTASTPPEELADLVRSGRASKCVIVTEPIGADIYIDGLKAGVTPLVFVLLKKSDTPRRVEIRMDGYRTIQKQLVPDGQLISISDALEKQ